MNRYMNMIATELNILKCLEVDGLQKPNNFTKHLDSISIKNLDGKLLSKLDFINDSYPKTSFINLISSYQLINDGGLARDNIFHMVPHGDFTLEIDICKDHESWCTSDLNLFQIAVPLTPQCFDEARLFYTVDNFTDIDLSNIVSIELAASDLLSLTITCTKKNAIKGLIGLRSYIYFSEDGVQNRTFF